MVLVERYERGRSFQIDWPAIALNLMMSIVIMSLLSVPLLRSLLAACSPRTAYSHQGVQTQYAPMRTHQACSDAAPGLSVCPLVRRRRCTLPNDKTPHDTASIEDILTRSPLPNAPSAPTHPSFPLNNPCEIVDSSSSRRPILQQPHPPSLDHGYRLHQGCCPAWVTPLTKFPIDAFTDPGDSCRALCVLTTSGRASLLSH